jgi:hypothetical protein
VGDPLDPSLVVGDQQIEAAIEVFSEAVARIDRA